MDSELASIIDDIYEAAAIPENWPKLLGRLSARIDGAGGLLFTANLDRIKWTASPDIQPLFDEFIRDGWAARNLRPARLAAANHAGFVRDNDVFKPEEMDSDPVYRDFYRKRGLGWCTGTLLNVPTGDAIIFSFERAYDKGPIETRSVRFYDKLRPHLARASLLSARLGLQQAQAMAGVFEMIGLPAAVLDGQGRLHAANPSFELLLPEVLQDRRERLAMTDPAADKLLAEARARLRLANDSTGPQSIPLPARDDRPAMVFHLLPVRLSAHDLFSRASAILVVTPVDRARVPNAQVLQALFDLTPAEARVARGVGEGRSLESMAADLEISQQTLRKQLKMVFSKTGLSRQAELVALLAGTELPFGQPMAAHGD